MVPCEQVDRKGDIALSTLSARSDEVALSARHASILSPKSRAVLINDACFDVVKGTLVVILGPPGSGKTTLLKTLLGETACAGGKVSLLTKSVAYCAQSAWIIDTTIARFIQGPSVALDHTWYQEVIQACDLAQDLQNLPMGDETKVGSRGITLSGGQKARLALARATYARRDVLLLDDVLSAVDARTESNIASGLASQSSPFRRGNRTIVAVSHSPKLIEIADTVLLLENGVLTEVNKTASSRLAGNEEFIRSFESPDEHTQLPKAMQSAARSPSPEQKQDMTRQTGDWSIYRYYLGTTSRLSLFLFIACSIGIAFCSSFTRELSR